MAKIIESRNGGVIVVTIVIAMILTLIPLPEIIRFARPEWVLLTLIYWAMALPHRVGIGVAWLTGLLMDAMLGSTLGVLAFAYALAIYVIARFHLQLRQYPLWQQAVTILTITYVIQFIFALLSSSVIDWKIFLPALSSTIIWPIAYSFLRNVRRTFHVS